MPRFLTLVSAFTIGFGASLALNGGVAQAEPICTDEMVAGEYGTNFDGFLAQARQNGKTQIFVQKPIRGIGTISLNDDNSAVVLIKGFVAETPQIDPSGPGVFEFSGTWFVNEDCTGEIDLIEFDATIDWIFVAVNGGTELFIISNASLGQLHAKRL